MKDYYEFTFEERLEAFRSMGRDNVPLLEYLDRTSVRRIPHIDEKCVIFSVDGDDTRTLKYVVDPETKRKLSFRLQAIVLRGLKNQASVQDVLGVQVLHSPSFHEGIEGLVGPFDYLEGFNLSHAPSDFIDSPHLVLGIFQEQMDNGIITEIHRRRIIHKDVKPGNIVYSSGRLYLIDWSTSSNFTEDLQDIRANRFLGTHGFTTFDLERSRDYFALGVTFAKTLLPDLELRGPLRIYDFENFAERHLSQIFGRQFSEYFRDLMNRPSEYDPSEIPWVESEEGLGIDPAFSFGIGNTLSVERGPLGLLSSPGSADLTWPKETPTSV